jgi:magnesium chelatase family protein
VIRRRVQGARLRQLERFQGMPLYTNAAMSAKEIKQFCQINAASEELLHQALKQLQISARAYHKILKVARTLADLEEKPDIESPHLIEAIQYRSLDRTLWKTNFE